jgi:hypothetical protein
VSCKITPKLHYSRDKCILQFILVDIAVAQHLQCTEVKYGFKCNGLERFVTVEVGFYSKHGVLEHAGLSAL